MIGKIYCINLDRRPEKWRTVQHEFYTHGLQVERMPGVDGNDFRIQYPCSPGNNGCTLSHLQCIERAKFLGFETIMILEDDVILHPDFNNLLYGAMDELPENWQLVYLGGTHREVPVKVSEHIYRVTKTLCVHAYIIRNTLFDFALDAFKSLHQPCDCYYADKQHEGNMYVINPPLAWQSGGFSDIVGRNMWYDWIKEPIK